LCPWDKIPDIIKRGRFILLIASKVQFYYGMVGMAENPTLWQTGSRVEP
jgi:hypothetical protein